MQMAFSSVNARKSQLGSLRRSRVMISPNESNRWWQLDVVLSANRSRGLIRLQKRHTR